jgi:hypothetical protein
MKVVKLHNRLLHDMPLIITKSNGQQRINFRSFSMWTYICLQSIELVAWLGNCKLQWTKWIVPMEIFEGIQTILTYLLDVTKWFIYVKLTCEIFHKWKNHNKTIQEKLKMDYPILQKIKYELSQCVTSAMFL